MSRKLVPSPTPKSASPKQLALLRFVGVSFREPLSSKDASVLIEEVINSANLRAKLAEWESVKLVMYPELYETETARRKSDDKRSRREVYYDFNGTDNYGVMLNRPTKAELQQVMVYLDANAPAWDERDDSDEFVLAGLQQLFPKRVKKGYEFPFPKGEPRKKLSDFSPGQDSKSGCFGLLMLLGFLILAAHHWAAKML